MNKTLSTIKYGLLAIICLTFFQSIATAQAEDVPKRTLQGVWEVTIIPRNCATGDPIPNAASKALYAFHNDGTMSVWAQNNTITTTRSPSFGLWQNTHGWSDYSFKFVHLRYNLTTGIFIGKQEGRGTLVLSESGDEFTTEGSVTLFDVNGNPGTPGCSNSVGTRFELDQ